MRWQGRKVHEWPLLKDDRRLADRPAFGATTQIAGAASPAVMLTVILTDSTCLWRHLSEWLTPRGHPIASGPREYYWRGPYTSMCIVLDSGPMVSTRQRGRKRHSLSVMSPVAFCSVPSALSGVLWLESPAITPIVGAERLARHVVPAVSIRFQGMSPDPPDRHARVTGRVRRPP